MQHLSKLHRWEVSVWIFVQFFSLIIGQGTLRAQGMTKCTIRLMKILEIRCNETPYKMGAGEKSIPLPALSFEFGPDGKVFLNDLWGHKVIVLDSSWQYLRQFSIPEDTHVDMSIDCMNNLFLWDAGYTRKFAPEGELLNTMNYRKLAYKNRLDDDTTAPSFELLLCNDSIGAFVDSLYWTGKAISVDWSKKWTNLLIIDNKQLQVWNISTLPDMPQKVTLKLPGFVYIGEPEDDINVWHVFRNESAEMELNFDHLFSDYFKFFVEVKDCYVLLSETSPSYILIFDKQGNCLTKFNLGQFIQKNNISPFSAIEENPIFLNKYRNDAYLMIRSETGVHFFRIEIYRK